MKGASAEAAQFQTFSGGNFYKIKGIFTNLKDSNSSKVKLFSLFAALAKVQGF